MIKSFLIIACMAITTLYPSEYESDAETVVEKFDMNQFDQEQNIYAFLHQLNNQYAHLQTQEETLRENPPYTCPSCIIDPLTMLRNACAVPSAQCVESKCVMASDYCCEKILCNVEKTYFNQTITSCCKLTCATLCVPLCKHVVTPDCIRCLCFTAGCYWLDTKKESK